MLVAPFLRRWNYTRVLEQVGLQQDCTAAVIAWFSTTCICKFDLHMYQTMQDREAHQHSLTSLLPVPSRYQAGTSTCRRGRT